jgi:hypothetical protein
MVQTFDISASSTLNIPVDWQNDRMVKIEGAITASSFGTHILLRPNGAMTSARMHYALVTGTSIPSATATTAGTHTNAGFTCSPGAPSGAGLEVHDFEVLVNMRQATAPGLLFKTSWMTGNSVGSGNLEAYTGYGGGTYNMGSSTLGYLTLAAHQGTMTGQIRVTRIPMMPSV